MTAYWLCVLWSMATQFYWEKMMGNLELYMLAPMSTMSILLGMAIGGIFMTSARAIAILLAGILLFGVKFSMVSPFTLGLVFLLTLTALFGLGMVFSSVFFLWSREGWHLSMLMQEPVYLLSGFYFPIRSLGFWTAVVASIIPLTLGLDGMRQLLFGSKKAIGFLSVRWEIGLLACLTVLFLILAGWSLRVMENLGKREGRISLRWE